MPIKILLVYMWCLLRIYATGWAIKWSASEPIQIFPPGMDNSELVINLDI